MHKYGITANWIAPVARSRMSGKVPFGVERGELQDVVPLVTFLLGEKARQITGQVYAISGGHIAVWNQPEEIRE